MTSKKTKRDKIPRPTVVTVSPLHIKFAKPDYKECGDGYSYDVRDVGEKCQLLEVIVKTPEKHVYLCYYMKNDKIEMCYSGDELTMFSPPMQLENNEGLELVEQIARKAFGDFGWKGIGR